MTASNVHVGLKDVRVSKAEKTVVVSSREQSLNRNKRNNLIGTRVERTCEGSQHHSCRLEQRVRERGTETAARSGDCSL